MAANTDTTSGAATGECPAGSGADVIELGMVLERMPSRLVVIGVEAADVTQGRLELTPAVAAAVDRVIERIRQLVAPDGAAFESRDHFFAVSAVAMRGILADHARRRAAAKRGGDWKRVTMSGVGTPAGDGEIDLLALDEALTKLATLSPRQARIIEYRFFSGMTVPQIAGVLGVSDWTIEEDGVYSGVFTPAMDGEYEIDVGATRDEDLTLGTDASYLHVGPSSEEYFDAGYDNNE